MLLTLRGPEYFPVLDQWLNDDDSISFVSILGQIVYCGYHAIQAPPALLDRLSQCQGLSRDQALALEQMGRELTAPTIPWDKVSDSLVLTGPVGPTTDPGGAIRWHRRDWKWLVDKRHLDVTVLAGENANDALWYRWLGRAWGARARPGLSRTGDEVELRCRGLGGQTAWQEILLAANEGDPILGIVDSDRDYDHPDAKLGDTAKAAKEYTDKRSTELLTRIEVLQARDVENILPLSLVKLAGEGTQWLDPMVERGFFARPAVDPALAYIDLGKDQCERRLLNTRHQATLDYRTRALARIRQADPTCTGSASTCEKLARGEQECNKPWSDLCASCIIVHSVGKRLLPNIVKLVEDEHKSPNHSRNTLSVADWLASMLPRDDLAVLGPARLAWSWGLRLRPRVRTV